VLLAALSPAGVEVGVDLRHRGGVVDGGGWVVGIVVVVAESSKAHSRCWLVNVNLNFSVVQRLPSPRCADYGTGRTETARESAGLSTFEMRNAREQVGIRKT